MLAIRMPAIYVSIVPKAPGLFVILTYIGISLYCFERIIVNMYQRDLRSEWYFMGYIRENVDTVCEVCLGNLVVSHVISRVGYFACWLFRMLVILRVGH